MRPGSTTISGKVFTPLGATGDPVYNALVYVPNGAPPGITDGPSCDQCLSLTSDQAVAGAISGPDGRFVIPNAPIGTGIPLVIQLGKWRHQVTIDVPNQCGDNPIADGLVRLPRNQGEGNIPLTAVTTGASDALEMRAAEDGRRCSRVPAANRCYRNESRSTGKRAPHLQAGQPQMHRIFGAAQVQTAEQERMGSRGYQATTWFYCLARGTRPPERTTPAHQERLLPGLRPMHPDTRTCSTTRLPAAERF